MTARPSPAPAPPAGVWITLAAAVNGAYLLAAGSANVFYVANILAHVVLGLALLAAWTALARALRAEDVQAGPTLALLIVAAGTGVALMLFGNLRPQRPLLIAHVLSSFAAAGLALRAYHRRGSLRPAYYRAALALLVLAAVVPTVRYFLPTAGSDTITNPVLPPVDLAGEAMGGAQGPFFPSPAATVHGDTIPAAFFLNSEGCGRAGCHPDLTAQWKASAHHFSSFNNPWYRKSIAYMQEVAGLEQPQWCAGCHDPALLYSGRMARPVDEIADTPAGQAGLGCVACHSVVSVKGTLGNGGLVMAYPALHDLATSPSRLLQAAHDMVLHLNPTPHREAFLRPFHREQPAAFCSSCHKVHLDAPVNNYRWVRGFNTYDNWQASGVSGEGARSFYAPPAPQTCLDCHMPRVPADDAAARSGLIRSHRFLAANTALPSVRADSAQLEATIAFLKQGALRVDLFAVSEPSELPAEVTGGSTGGEPARRPGREPLLPEAASTFAVGEEQGQGVGTGSLTRRATAVFAPLTDAAPVLRPGTSVRLDVVVRTLKLGHFFPTGTVDAQEAWLEVEAVDGDGRTLLHSGGRDGEGTVDPSAHFFRNRLVDGRANLIDKRNAWASRAVVYVNLIPPGAADVAHYRLHIPEDAAGPITLTARLHYRKFDTAFHRFTFAGRRDPADPHPDVTLDYDDGRWLLDGGTPPSLPVVTLAADSLTLPLVPNGSALGVEPGRGPAARERWNDYGIGLLLQGDLHGAEQAFRAVTAIEPDYADGWVNLARVYLQDGNLEAATRALEGAERMRPGYHKTRFFRGLLRKALGEYAEALADLEAVASDYPRDRVVLNQIGRLYYLQDEPAAAVPYFERVLRIDAEDLMAHYNLALLYRVLGDADRADAHALRYQRYKDDEASQALARRYRQTHPHDNNEALPIHEHR